MNKIRLEIKSILNDQTAEMTWNSLPKAIVGVKKNTQKRVPIKMESDMFMKVIQLY